MDMNDTELYKKIHPNKYLRNYLEKNVRPDYRKFTEFRPVIINTNSISSAEGSALVKMGNTSIMCGIKAELTEPENTEPDKGFIVPNIELTKLCSPKYRAVGVSIDSQILNQTLFNILMNSECVNLSDLCISKGKLVWVLYCDLVCLDDDGSVLDVAIIALMAALKCLKLPTVEYDVDTKQIKVDESVRIPLNLKSLPISSTFVVFEGKYLLADPSTDEEDLSDCSMTISICDGEVSYIYKPGGSSVTDEHFKTIVKEASSREKYIKSLIEAAISNVPAKK